MIGRGSVQRDASVTPQASVAGTEQGPSGSPAGAILVGHRLPHFTLVYLAVVYTCFKVFFLISFE